MLDLFGRKEVLNNIKDFNKKYGIIIVLIIYYMDEVV